MNTTEITAAGYIVEDIDALAIYGIGVTSDAAWSEAAEGFGPFFDAYGDAISDDVARETKFNTRKATAELLAQVVADGGAIAWGAVDGIACTVEQEEAAA